MAPKIYCGKHTFPFNCRKRTVEACFPGNSSEKEAALHYKIDGCNAIQVAHHEERKLSGFQISSPEPSKLTTITDLISFNNTGDFKQLLITKSVTMKQKMVVKVGMHDAKSRSKAMKIAVSLPGVISASIEGADKNQIVVVGEGVDSVDLTTLLRKRMGPSELVSVSAVDEKKENKPPAAPSTVQVIPWPYQFHSTIPQPQFCYGYESPYPQNDGCSIL